MLTAKTDGDAEESKESNQARLAPMGQPCLAERGQCYVERDRQGRVCAD